MLPFAFMCSAYPLLTRYSEDSQLVTKRLQLDLKNLGVSPGGNSVQCMDTTNGCLDALLRMNVTMVTGYVSDYYFFLPAQTGFVTEMRRDFLSQMYDKDPCILVITNQQWPTITDEGYEQLKRWPSLLTLLEKAIPSY